MNLPLVPADRADAGQVGQGSARAGVGRRRPALRAQVGRLPLHRLPRRRRGRAVQPRRAAADPLLPRGRRGGARAAAGAVRRRRRDRHRAAAPSWTSRRCCSASTRPSRGSTCWPSETPASFVAFDLLALGDDDLMADAVRRAARRARAGAGRRRAAGLPHPRDRRRRPGAAVVRAVRGRRARRRRRQAARPAVPAGRAGRCSRSSTSGPRTAWSPASAGTSQRPGRRLAAARPVRRRGRRCSTSASSASFPMARRAELVDGAGAVARRRPRRPPVGRLGALRREAHADRMPGAQPLEREQGPVLGAAAAGAGRRGGVRPHGGHPVPAHRAVPPLAARPRPARPARTTSSTGRSRSTSPRCWGG